MKMRTKEAYFPLPARTSEGDSPEQKGSKANNNAYVPLDSAHLSGYFQQLPQASVSYKKMLESIGIRAVEQTPLEALVLTRWNDGTPSTLLVNQQKPEPAMDARRKQKAMERIVLDANTSKAEMKGYAGITAANIYRN